MSSLHVWNVVLGLSTVVAWPAFAVEFTCENLTLTRHGPSAADPAHTTFPEIARLHLIVDKVQPGNSTLRWSGAPEMDGISSTWPADTKIIESNGVIAVSFSAESDGLASVGSATIDAGGALRMIENTIVADGVVYDVLEATCQRRAG